MDTTDHLQNIIQRQKELLAQLEAAYRAVEGRDVTRENTALKAELEKLRLDFERAENSAATLAGENAGLKNALYEQMYNEKINMIHTATQKMDIYFRAGTDGELNKLTALENRVRARIDSITATLVQHNIDAQDDVYKKLYELTALLDSKVTQARAKAAQVSAVFSPEEREELEGLKNEQITDEQVRSVAKKNNLERFVGLNLLNAIGIFLLIIGVITAARYTYVQLPDLLKGIMMFALGGVMLAAGEILNRKKPNVFSLGISAGGVGLLYVALATSYFGLHILDVYPAIAVCLLVTAGAFVLSDRYHSQTITAFALIGGYLPLFSIGGDTAMLYGAMIYFVVLNLLALLLSFNKKWRVASFIGLFLNIVGTVCICLIGMDFYAAGFYFPHMGGHILERVTTILYVTFAFLVYTLIPIVSTYRTKTKFRKSDVVLLAINTVFSSLIMYGVFYAFDWQDYHGLLAIGFAVIYLLLGRFVEKKVSGEDRYAKALFYLTGLAFVVLIIPLQFGRAWLSLGWLAEGVLLAAYGILHQKESFKRAGGVISLLCLGAFVLFDCLWAWRDALFAYKYLAITLGSAVILGAYMYKKTMAGQFVRLYKCAALANVWLYMLYILGKLEDILLRVYPGQTTYHIHYLMAAAAIVATFLLAYTVPRIRLLSDLGTKILAVVLYAAGLLGLFCLNVVNRPIAHEYLRAATPSLGITLVGVVILLAVGLLSVLAARDLVKLIVTERKLGVEWYPLIIFGYFVIILTQNLITQFNLSFSSAVISIIYVLTALAWIVFGFMKRYSFIRRFGLGLAILAVVKLFLVDLASLTQGYRIVSYFALGVTLIAISFVYQYFSKRLELKEGVAADVEKKH
ncbi:MAG: DUF2339 domain-containing protein [Peptococcaceae bacterium]|nr:DUF2339 domain-containing protein [Peptococcaceae bacterium]